jgi:hypothetical protein
MEPEEINFEVIKEVWNEYNLEDNSILKVKIVLIRVLKEITDQKGNPRFGFLTSNVIGVIPSKDILGSTELSPIEDMKFDKIKDIEWNEYKIDKDKLLMIQPIISEVNRTNKRDPRRDPIYVANVQSSIKIKKLPRELKN